MCSKVWWLVDECQAWNYLVALNLTIHLCHFQGGANHKLSSWGKYVSTKIGPITITLVIRCIPPHFENCLIIHMSRYLMIFNVWYAIGMAIGRKTSLMDNIYWTSFNHSWVIIQKLTCHYVQVCAIYGAMKRDVRMKYNRYFLFLLFLKWVVDPLDKHTNYTQQKTFICLNGKKVVLGVDLLAFTTI
jgi:hypothetical protein